MVDLILIIKLVKQKRIDVQKKIVEVIVFGSYAKISDIVKNKGMIAVVAIPFIEGVILVKLIKDLKIIKIDSDKENKVIDSL